MGIQSGVWRHYKGTYYLVLGMIAQHTERDEQLVIYVPLTGNLEEDRAGLRLRARPLMGDKGFLTMEKVNGIMVNRFTFIGQEIPK